jgi:hypothetical protein
LLGPRKGATADDDEADDTTDLGAAGADDLRRQGAARGDGEGDRTGVADTVERLVEFASGRPDSRADAGIDWPRGLAEEELAIVHGWVEVNAARSATTDGPPEGRR